MGLFLMIFSKLYLIFLNSDTHNSQALNGSTSTLSHLVREPADPPHQRLVVQVPHGNVAVAAA